MALSLERHFGVHDDALLLRSRRAELLAVNLANSDTPQYKARDLDFRQVLAETVGRGTDAPMQVRLAVTRDGHLKDSGEGGFEQALYRMPYQASLDGNTVEPHVEKAEFAANALRYRASLNFVNQKIEGLRKALRVE